MKNEVNKKEINKKDKQINSFKTFVYKYKWMFSSSYLINKNRIYFVIKKVYILFSFLY